MKMTDIITKISQQKIEWSYQDIENILEDNNIEPTKDNVEKFVNSPKFNFLKNYLLGNSMNYFKDSIKEVFKEDKPFLKVKDILDFYPKEEYVINVGYSNSCVLLDWYSEEDQEVIKTHPCFGFRLEDINRVRITLSKESYKFIEENLIQYNYKKDE